MERPVRSKACLVSVLAELPGLPAQSRMKDRVIPDLRGHWGPRRRGGEKGEIDHLGRGGKSHSSRHQAAERGCPGDCVHEMTSKAGRAAVLRHRSRRARRARQSSRGRVRAFGTRSSWARRMGTDYKCGDGCWRPDRMEASDISWQSPASRIAFVRGVDQAAIVHADGT